MAPILTDEEMELDPYALLEVKLDATEKELQRAYRQKSLKWHPDKNPDNPTAAAQFHLISLAFAILVDPAKRSYLNNKLEEDRRRKEKYAGLEKRKRGMVDSLLAREEEARKAKLARTQAVRDATAEEQVKEAGRKMREEAAAAQAKTASQAASAAATEELDASMDGLHTEDTRPEITPLDLTLSLQFPPSSSTSPAYLESTAGLSTHLSSLYGPLAHVLLKPGISSSSPPPDSPSGEKKSKRKSKGPKAVVEFKEGNWAGCWACWRDNSEKGKGKLGDGVKVKWAAGDEAPAWVAWADSQSAGRSSTVNAKATSAASSFPSFFPSLSVRVNGAAGVSASGKGGAKDDESITLLRMRQLERERMAEKMRREEEEEEAGR